MRRRQDELLRSVEYFNLAIAKEPGYALAYAGLSDSYSVLSGGATGPDRKELLDRARRAAQKATELDDSLSDAHASLAVCSWDWNWQEDEREFRRALELSPGNATAHHWYARLLDITGRTDEALIEARRAVELNPLSPSPNLMLGGVFYAGRQYDRAIEQLRHTTEAFPDYTQGYAVLGLAYEAKAMHREAIGVLQTAMRLTDGAPTIAALLAHAHAGAGDKSDAQRLLNEFANRKDITPVVFALLYMDVGNKDRAFEWFGRGVDEHSMFIDELKVEPMYDGLRSDPRFTALLRKMRLVQ